MVHSPNDALQSQKVSGQNSPRGRVGGQKSLKNPENMENTGGAEAQNRTPKGGGPPPSPPAAPKEFEIAGAQNSEAAVAAQGKNGLCLCLYFLLVPLMVGTTVCVLDPPLNALLLCIKLDHTD